MRLAILTHGDFPEHAKTAIGVLRYGDQEVVALVDRERAGQRAGDVRTDLPDVPFVEDVAAIPGPVDALLVGVAPVGGGLEPEWRPDLRAAIERGWDVLAGLHDYLADDPEFAALAAEYGVELRDLRRPPGDLQVANARAAELSATVVLTVGTDCSVGKMTTSYELVAGARERGIDAAVVPTGQTAVAVEGEGIAVDAVPVDFAAGAVESMLLERADRELLVVEGQASVVHPGYSGLSTALLHGAVPDALVLCHEAGRETVRGFDHPLCPPGKVARLHEAIAEPVRPAPVVAGALDTSGLAPEAAEAAAADYAATIGAPACDPVRNGAGTILDAL